MPRTARTLTPLIALTVLAALAGCSDGPSGSAVTPTTSGRSTTPTASGTPTTPSVTQPQPTESSTGLRLDADGCPVLPHGWNLCDDEHQTWSLPLATDEQGHWTHHATVGFSSDGTMTFSDSEGPESVGTWKYDGAYTVAVRFNAAVPALGTDVLTLTVGEFERGCGDPPVYEPWDALTSAQPALRIEPHAC